MSYLQDLFRKLTVSSEQTTLDTSSSKLVSTALNGLKQYRDHPSRGEFNGRPVSIFTSPPVINVRRLKTLKHPNILLYVSDAPATSSSPCLLVTEGVDTFNVDLARGHQDWRALLAFQLASAILFLNKQAGIIHGNLGKAAFFIDDTGMFKLGGFGEESVLTRRGDSSDAEKLDALARRIGCDDASQLSDRLLASIDQPAALMFINKELNIDGKSLEQISQDFCSHRLVQVVQRLDNLSIDGEIDRLATIRAAADFISNANTPKPLLFKVLKAIWWAGWEGERRVQLKGHQVVEVLVSCASRLWSREWNVYNQYCLGVFDALLKSSVSDDQFDQNSRLYVMNAIAPNLSILPDSFIQTNVYSSLTRAVANQSALMRDTALRCLISIADRLQESVRSSDLLKQISRLQDDQQTGIRANALIGLSQLEEKLSDQVRSKIVGPAYCRGLVDPFPPCKIAALNGLIKSHHLCSREEIATKLLPCICPLLVDADKEIAGRALKLVDLFVIMMKETTRPISPDLKQPLNILQSPSPKGDSLPTSIQAVEHPVNTNVEIQQFDDC